MADLGFWTEPDFTADDDFDLSIDYDSFLSILGEAPDSQENGQDYMAFENVLQNEPVPEVGNQGNTLLPNGIHPQMEEPPSVVTQLHRSFALPPTCYDSGPPYSVTEELGGFFAAINDPDMNFEYGKLQPSVQVDSPGSFKDWICRAPTQNAPSHSRIDSKATKYEMVNGSNNMFSFPSGDAKIVSDPTMANFNHMNHEAEYQFRPLGEFAHAEYASKRMNMEKPELNFGNLNQDVKESFEIPGKSSFTTPEMSCADPDMSWRYTSHTGTGVCETSDNYSNMQHGTSQESKFFDDSSRKCQFDSYNLPCMLNDEQIAINIEDGEEGFQNESAFINRLFDDEVSMNPSPSTGPYMLSEANIKGERTDGFFSKKSFPRSNTELFNCVIPPPEEKPSKRARYTLEIINGSVSREPHQVVDNGHSRIPPSVSSIKRVIHPEEERLEPKRARHSLDIIDGVASRKHHTVADDDHSNVQVSGHLPCFTPPISTKSTSSQFSTVNSEVVESDSSDPRSQVDDESEICILEDISKPARPNPCPVYGKSLVPSPRYTYNEAHESGVSGTKLRTNDERFILRVALQGLSQPKSETSPPDGYLAVPLLRHQRIALSWMIQKETAGFNCYGGILADDQGLGKTISTIALILKERSPSSGIVPKDEKQGELETLDLDEDDDRVPNPVVVKQEISSEVSAKSKNTLPQVNKGGRLAAGTLVVCPTSVLKQWDEELHNKVTQKANLSVLLYHGSNRTKDPSELAKYDVVLTTYSIVSMEVPKQPLVDKDDDEKVNGEAHDLPPMGLSSTNKKKYSGKKRSKDGKELDSALLESGARPLARVGWFRVVLDEAQSIKNHRTQTARACWGLRAKRRWCLSGTPIQNAVDDLYSYFRFLRYDPYAVYKSFCASIKVPITKNPTNGYKKLQAVLKTIMLRRTKGTFLDGKPIINLPPKTIELKKVNFTKEERDFYSRLEDESRAQFQVYAAAGTVKQNYVNILLMLLRLRQACDHPLLVKGFDSPSWRFSVEMAKKLPQEKKIGLLNCLEASLAICGICNDPPEDAVVTICGHVFCKQCICEHLTSDETQCPSTNCKVQIGKVSVFSGLALRRSLFEPTDVNSTSDNITPDGSGSELVETLKPCSNISSADSSKIKAALEVLLSLSRPQDRAMKVCSLKPIDETLSENSGGSFKDVPDDKTLNVDGVVNVSTKRVGEKAIVFSQWTRMLDLLEDCLKSSSIQYRRLDGTMSIVARDKAVKDFNTLPEVSVMIMSLKAASLGLNMVAACHVLLLDLWWNPTTEDQAIDRAHRIGQTRPVSVLRLTVKDTVEDRILALQQKKREMVASAFGEDETGSRQSRLTVEDLKYLFMA